MRLLSFVFLLLASSHLASASPNGTQSDEDIAIHARVVAAIEKITAHEAPPPLPVGHLRLFFVARVLPQQEPLVIEIASAALSPDGGILRFTSKTKKGLVATIGEYQMEDGKRLVIDAPWRIGAEFFEPVENHGRELSVSFSGYNIEIPKHLHTFARGNLELWATTKITTAKSPSETLDAVCLVALWR